ncbi:MAG: radical SAM protein [Polyangiales bacterium]
MPSPDKPDAAPPQEGALLARILTNRRCNQNCVYCNQRSERDDLAAIAPKALAANIDRAASEGARALRLTGGEPAMRGDLVALVAHARARGFTRVVVETNATLLDDARAAALAAAGLTGARVNFLGVDPAIDAVTRDPGGAARAVAGVRALLRAGVEVELLVALTRSTAPWLAAMPGAALAAFGDLGRPRLVEAVVPAESPDPSELLGLDEAVAALRALDEACLAVALPTRLAAGSDPPPCAFPPRRGIAHLYALSPGARRPPTHRAIAACQGCLVADRCPGWSAAWLARHGEPAAHPVAEERARRRLHVVRALPEQIAHELVDVSASADASGAEVRDEIVRINFHCNQSCAFCFVSTHLPPAADAAIEAAIRAAGARGSRVVLSGGEPTLNRRLVDWVRLAASVSPRPVGLQTNAVRLDDEALCRALADAGLAEAMVSLHAATAELSDAITEAPGTFARTLRGLDHLAAAGVRVGVNFVFCEANRGAFADVVRLVASRWPAASIVFSFVALSTDLVPRDRQLVPRFSEMAPALADGIAEARRLGVAIGNFESMCGVPLCVIPDGFDRASLPLLPVPRDLAPGEFVKADGCSRCRYDAVCYGVRRHYAALHGLGELAPVTP